MKKLLFLFFLNYVININCYSQTVTDVDGNIYSTVTIGTQVWMKENLKVKHYKNGNPIAFVTDDFQWQNLTSGAYCIYNNDSNNISTYGLLYNWYVTNDTNLIAPKGWHVPSDSEWYVLSAYLGDSLTVGGKLKEAGLTHWQYPNTGATNSSGFTGLPSGYRDYSGFYNHLGAYNNFWSTTETNNNQLWVYHRGMGYITEEILRYIRVKTYGFSIRCVKDYESTGVFEEKEKKLNIYPNPVFETLTIESSQKPLLEIYNIQGEKIYSKKLMELKIQIDVSFLNSGIYFIKILSDKKTTIKKFIKN